MQTTCKHIGCSAPVPCRLRQRLIEKTFLLHAGFRDSLMSSSGQGRTTKAGSHLCSRKALGYFVSLSSHSTTAAEAIDQTSTQPCLAVRLVGTCFHLAWAATCQHCLLMSACRPETSMDNFWTS